MRIKQAGYDRFRPLNETPTEVLDVIFHINRAQCDAVESAAHDGADFIDLAGILDLTPGGWILACDLDESMRQSDEIAWMMANGDVLTRNLDYGSTWEGMIEDWCFDRLPTMPDKTDGRRGEAARRRAAHARACLNRDASAVGLDVSVVLETPVEGRDRSAETRIKHSLNIQTARWGSTRGSI